MNKGKKQSILNKINYLYLFLILVCLFSFISTIPIVYADDSKYTSVEEDLLQDSSFSLDDYPTINSDYSLQVIQIAESNEKELFVYVYQPYYKDNASSINISTAINDSLYYQNYFLTYIDNYETIFKYKVNDFVVKDDALRYYDISSIYRPFDEDIDEELDNDNTIDEVSFDVSKLFTASTVNGEVSYTCVESETIEITDKYVGYVRYLNGFWLYEDSCDSHFVAFSTDYQIDKLMEADLTYISETGSGSLATGGWTVDSTETITKTIYADEKVTSDMTGPFGYTYTWHRIESVSEFIEDVDLTDDAENNIKNMQWVLRFAETDYMEYNGLYYPHYDATRISEVTILRLKFETNGIVYNLGVIDNKQTGDDIPDNNQISIFEEILKWFVRIAITILLIILIIVLFPYFPAIFSAIWKFIVIVAKCVWYVISAPFSVFNDDD